MSGYLEVKYSFKSNLGLNPFKTWKRQWCILRPSSTCSGGSLAVYCSEAGAAAGAVELPAGGAVRATKSRSRAHAFGVFSALEPHKPRVLLAAHTSQDAQLWMDKIRALLDGKQFVGAESLGRSYSVSIVASALSRKLGLSGDCVVALAAGGVRVSRSHNLVTLVEWRHVKDTTLATGSDKNKICVLNVHSGFHGGGCLKLCTPQARELARAARPAARRSRSEGDLPAAGAGENRRSSWSSGAPPEQALDDTDLLMLKESTRIPSGLARCAAAPHLPPSTLVTAVTPVTAVTEVTAVTSAAPESTRATAGSAVADKAIAPVRARLVASATIDDCMSDRRSLLSIASGIYEEIADPPARDEPDHPQPIKRSGQCSDKCSDRCSDQCRDACGSWWEPTYESVAECVGVYATVRRARRPPPLPPRAPFGTSKLDSWNSRMNAGDAARHGSLGSIPRCHSLGSAPHKTATLPKPARQPFSVFRKRLKSDSRTVSPKDTKENKDVETKKKKFDFTPTRELFKNFKVSRKMKNLKIAPGSLSKGETKSCEFLDETEHVTTARCSKSVECLEGSEEYLDEFDGDLSLEFSDDAVASLALPQEIAELIARARGAERARRLAPLGEGLYTPMSPIVAPAPAEHHYMAMSPRTNLV